MTDAAITSYRVLARKYRPSTLEDVIGQETLVQVLTQSIQNKRLPHAFILTGIRGIGKTTLARILAKMLNCVGPQEDQTVETIAPCNICSQCQAINQDRHMDVLEMDAASRTGVDDIREIIESCQYKPVLGRWRVYIIDEVHMLSKNAFNALLKTLEEPPPHVKFIFATTEIKKVPDTVLSRCMRFELKRFNEHDLFKLFTHVLNQEQLTAEPDALYLLCRAASGSARDGLSLLDQALNIKTEDSLTTDTIRQMLNLVDQQALITLIRQLLTGDIKGALTFLDQSYQQGQSATAILEALLNLCHQLTLIKTQAELCSLNLMTASEQQDLMDLANQISLPVLMRCWQVLLQGLQETQIALSVLQAVQMIFIRLAYMSPLPTPNVIIEQFKIASPHHSAPAPVRPLETQSIDDIVGLVNNKNKVIQPIERQVDAEQSSPITSIESSESLLVPMPENFKALINLMGQKREVLLQAALHHDVYLIDYKPGKITLRLNELAPRDLILKLSERLQEWTGQPWIFEVMSEGGDPSLVEQAQHDADQKLLKIRENKLVQAVLESFPGSKIGEIIDE